MFTIHSPGLSARLAVFQSLDEWTGLAHLHNGLETAHFDPTPTDSSSTNEGGLSCTGEEPTWMVHLRKCVQGIGMLPKSNEMKVAMDLRTIIPGVQ